MDVQTWDFTFSQMHQKKQCDCGISTRWSDGKIDLWNRKISCGTHQTHCNTEVRTLSRSLRISLHKTDPQRRWHQNGQNLPLDRLINGTAVTTSSAQESTGVRCEQSSGNTGKLIHGSIETSKGVENPADIGTRGMSIEDLKKSVFLNGQAWLQRSEDTLPKPWCQENELEPEQITSTVAIESKLGQLFDQRQWSSFNQIRNFIAYCIRYKTKQKEPLKAEEIELAEQFFFSIYSKRKLAECFEVDSKHQRNLKNIEHCQIFILHGVKWNN